MARTPQSNPPEPTKRDGTLADEDKGREAERANKQMKREFYERPQPTGAEGIEGIRKGNPD